MVIIQNLGEAYTQFQKQTASFTENLGKETQYVGNLLEAKDKEHKQALQSN